MHSIENLNAHKRTSRPFIAAGLIPLASDSVRKIISEFDSLEPQLLCFPRSIGFVFAHGPESIQSAHRSGPLEAERRLQAHRARVATRAA